MKMVISIKKSRLTIAPIQLPTMTLFISIFSNDDIYHNILSLLHPYNTDTRALQENRMGKTGMESRLIGTVARCKLCSQSKNWLGGKLWLSQHLDSVGMTDSDQTYILEAITRIKENAGVGRINISNYFRHAYVEINLRGNDE